MKIMFSLDCKKISHSLSPRLRAIPYMINILIFILKILLREESVEYELHCVETRIFGSLNNYTLPNGGRLPIRIYNGSRPAWE